MNVDINKNDIIFLLEQAIVEDISDGDITSQSILDPNQDSVAYLKAKQTGIISGTKPASILLEKYTNLDFILKKQDGNLVDNGDIIMVIKGKTVEILTYERVLNNIIEHLSGVATYTNKFIQYTKGTKVKILDTRKTTPGLRKLEKLAVFHGGGVNHRLGLYDAVLIKENHIKAVGGIKNAIKKVRKSKQYEALNGTPDFFLEVETESIEDVREAIQSKVDRILLDNMNKKEMQQAIELIRSTASNILIEISGNVDLKCIEGLVQLKPDFISIGKITHSAPSLDISLIIE